MTTTQAKSAHGGFREGSGRKPILDGGIKRTFVLTQAHLAMLDAWGSTHHLDNRSAALRHLIETAKLRSPLLDERGEPTERYADKLADLKERRLL